MSHRGPRAVEVVLSPQEREELERVAADGPRSRSAERARIVLACADGASNNQAAMNLGVTVATVRKWRGRFAAERLFGLADDPRPGRPKAELILSEEERAQLTRWATRAKTPPYLALRARIVLACAGGGANTRVAADLGVATGTVHRWRARFVAERLEGLRDEPRPGRPPSILPEQVEEVVIATLESAPDRGTHWSRASMAAHTGLSKSTIGRIWNKYDLKHHSQDSHKVSTDPSPGQKVF